MAVRRTTVFAELLTEGRIDGDAWAAAHAARSPVAQCGCGGRALTHPRRATERHFGQVWFAMTCERCGEETEVRGDRQFPAGPRVSLALLEAHAEVERARLAEA